MHCIMLIQTLFLWLLLGTMVNAAPAAAVEINRRLVMLPVDMVDAPFSLLLRNL